LPAAILLVDGALEFGRELKASLFVHARWVIAAKHWSFTDWPVRARKAKEAEAAKNRVQFLVLGWFAGVFRIICIRIHSRPL
jgi:hypothetical protein